MIQKTFFSIVSLCLIGVACQENKQQAVQYSTTNVPIVNRVVDSGMTITTRVNPLDGYTRVTYPENSFSNYIRSINLLEAGTLITNWDNSLYYMQDIHFGIIDVSIDGRFMQCADALIKLRTEYLWENNQQDKIGFEFTSGDYCSWSQYAAGYRPRVRGNNVQFLKTAAPNASKDNLYRYLDLIYKYAGTLSMQQEMEPVISSQDIQIGDFILKGGSPGHVVMIADVIENEVGKRRYILMQGNTPAQSIHLMNNLSDPAISPWYEVELGQTVDAVGNPFDNLKVYRFK